MSTSVSIIGAGFSGISSAAFLARDGYQVDVYERHEMAGGRARQFEADGFVYDMGPSWYWMPDVFERFFNAFGSSATDHYKLHKLDPSFAIVFGKDDIMDVPAEYDALREMFEQREPGSAARLDKFMREAGYKYDVSMADLVYQPSVSWMEFLQWKLAKGVLRLDVFKSLRGHVRKYFRDPGLVALMEFPVLFLGGEPRNTPALYSLMNYAGLKLGTWYPEGGFHKVVTAMQGVAEEAGAKFHFMQSVEHIEVIEKSVTSLVVNGRRIETSAVVASADYSHVDRTLLEPAHRMYSEAYWTSRTMAPSCLIFYIGVEGKVRNLRHHNLFFDEDLDIHSKEIYGEPKWPTNPLFYVCCPSKTDESVAPAGKENLFLLMPIAPGLTDTDVVREQYYDVIMDRLESVTGQNIRSQVTYIRSYCVNDFVDDYGALKGNAYGLANTLRQTAVMRPRIQHHKVRNLFYAGHLTVPGPGVPPAIISGQVAANYLMKKMPIAI